MPEIECDFGSMYVRVRGKGREAVVLLHDFFGTHQGWTAQQVQLSRHHLVLAPDLRGHGRSPLRRGSLSIAEMASDIATMLEFFKIDRAHLIGCSHGAIIALHMARIMPKRVESIVVTSAPDLNVRAVQEYGRAYVESVYPRLRNDIQQLHGDGGEGYLRDILLQSFIDSLDEPPRDHLDAFRLAGEIERPVLVLSGDRDPVMAPEQAVELMRRVPDARLCILPDAGHLAHQEAALMYTEAVLDHIARCQAG